MIEKKQSKISNLKFFYELEGTCIAQNGSYKGKFKGRFQHRNQIIELLSKHLKNQPKPYIGVVKSVEVKDKKNRCT